MIPAIILKVPSVALHLVPGAVEPAFKPIIPNAGNVAYGNPNK
jgi:hypothetical protein